MIRADITAFLEAGKTYTLSYKGVGNVSGYASINMDEYTDGTRTQSGKATITIKEGCVYYIKIYTNRTDTAYTGDITIEYTDIQLEEGSTATTFEEYGASPSPDYPSEIQSIGYENLFKPTLIADDGKKITVAYATVELEDDEFILTCKNGTDMYFGQVANEGTVHDGTRGNLIDISDCSSISYNVSNDLLTSNFLTFYNEEKVSLGYKYYNITKHTVQVSSMPIGTKYIAFRFGYSKATIGETYRTRVQVEKGSIIHSYVPYGKYAIELINEGKNKIDPHIGSNTWSGLTGAYDPKTDTFNVKGTTTVAGGVAFSITDSKFKLKKGVAYTQSVQTVSGVQGMHIVPSVKNSKGVITYNYFHDNKTRIPEEDLTINTYNVYINTEAGVSID